VEKLASLASRGSERLVFDIPQRCYNTLQTTAAYITDTTVNVTLQKPESRSPKLIKNDRQTPRPGDW
jgi:hypothetical protein